MEKKCRQENENIVLVGNIFQNTFLKGMKIHFLRRMKIYLLTEIEIYFLTEMNINFLRGMKSGRRQQKRPIPGRIPSRRATTHSSRDPAISQNISKIFFLESERSAYEEKIPDISLINQCDWSTQAKRLSLSSIYL